MGNMRAESHSEGSRVWVVLDDRPYRNGKTLPVTLAFLTPQPSGLRTEENPNYWLFSPDEVEKTAKLFAAAPEMLEVLKKCEDSLHELAGVAGDAPEWNEGGAAYEACEAIRKVMRKIGDR